MNNNFISGCDVSYLSLIRCLSFRIRESIETASMSDLKDFLENIRRFSPKIGEVAMRHVSCGDFYLLLGLYSDCYFYLDKRTISQ